MASPPSPNTFHMASEIVTRTNFHFIHFSMSVTLSPWSSLFVSLIEARSIQRRQKAICESQKIFIVRLCSRQQSENDFGLLGRSQVTAGRNDAESGKFLVICDRFENSSMKNFGGNSINTQRRCAFIFKSTHANGFGTARRKN